MLAEYDAFIKLNQVSFSTSPKLLKRLRKPTLKLEPFSNINKARNGALLGEAIAEEVRLILSRLSNAITVTDPIGQRAVDHDYILSGAVQGRGSFLRIIARLVSSSDGTTIWSERYECNLNDSFDVQDQISQEIVSALQLHLTDGQQVQLWRRGTSSGKAWEFFQTAHDQERRFTRQGHAKAKELYREALHLDRNYLSASVALGFCYLDEVRLGWSRNNKASIGAAQELCDAAMHLTTNHADVFALQAFLFYFKGQWGEAAAEMLKAVELAPFSPEMVGYQGALNDLMGKHKDAIANYTRALSLSAHVPAWIASNLGLSCLAVGDIEESERIYREVLNHHPNYERAWIGLAVALNRQGKIQEGKEAARTVMDLDPMFNAEEWAKSRPFQDDNLVQLFVRDLRAVGIP